MNLAGLFPRAEAMHTATETGSAFYIRAIAEPEESSLEKQKFGTRIILYDAPSEEAARVWAAGHVDQLLLKEHPERKLKELIVLPFDERLFATRGISRIVWHALVDDAAICEARDSHRIERCSSAGYIAPNRIPPEQDRLKDHKALRKQIPHSERLNWNEKKEFYYILYQDKRAFVVRAMNMFVASEPYIAAVKGTPDGDYDVKISAWPGAKRY